MILVMYTLCGEIDGSSPSLIGPPYQWVQHKNREGYTFNLREMAGYASNFGFAHSARWGYAQTWDSDSKTMIGHALAYNGGAVAIP